MEGKGFIDFWTTTIHCKVHPLSTLPPQRKISNKTTWKAVLFKKQTATSLKLTLILPLNINGWKIYFFLGRPVFRGHVNFRRALPCHTVSTLLPRNLRWFTWKSPSRKGKTSSIVHLHDFGFQPIILGGGVHPVHHAIFTITGAEFLPSTVW